MNDNFLDVAKKAALEAGKVIQKYTGTLQNKNVKHEDPSDFATDADIEAEKKIISIISESFPKHNIITEEQENIQKGSEYTWVIDPLDGTFSFIVGMPTFGVSIGLLYNNEPFLGVILNVSTGEMCYAEKGQGAFMNGTQIKVSQREKLENCSFVLDFGHIKNRQEKINTYVKPLMNKIGYAYSIGSAVGVLSLTARGILDGTINQGWVWDFAAGTIIIREAGGKVTDLKGEELDWDKERMTIVATNGLIHDQILEALKI